MRVYPYLELGIRDFRTKSVRDSRLTTGFKEIWVGITGLKTLSGDPPLFSLKTTIRVFYAHNNNNNFYLQDYNYLQYCKSYVK